MSTVAERASVSTGGLGGLRYAIHFTILIASIVSPQARGGVFLRDSIPDLFDLGAARGARLAVTSPDSDSNTYNIDAAFGVWADVAEKSAVGVVGIVGEFHRATQQRNPVNSRRFMAASWNTLSVGSAFLPTSEGLGWRRDVVRGISSYEGYFKSSLIVPRTPGQGTPPLWRSLIWSTSYSPILGGAFVAAGSPAVGINYQSVDSGGSGSVLRSRVEYFASVKGAGGALEKLGVDFGWNFQRRISGRGAYATGPRDTRRTRISLGYSCSEGVALVAERIDGEDPFEGTGRDHFTSLSLRVRLGDGPPGR